MGRWHGRSWFPALAVIAATLGVASAVAGPGSVPRARADTNDITLLAPGGSPLRGSWQRWARASLMPTVGGRVTVHLSGCPALPRAAGCVYRKHPRTVYIRRRTHHPRAVLLHELGHLFDLRVMNNRDRGRFRRIMHAKRRRWWAGRIPLAEQFAEAYSFCARYHRIVSIGRFSSYHYRPSRSQHRSACALIVAAARDRRPAVPAPHAPPVTRADPVPPPQPSSSPGTVPGGKPKPAPTPPPAPRPVPIVPPVPTLPPLP